MSKFGKVIPAKYLPVQISLLTPFVVYTLIDYWKLPMWVFLAWFSLWLIAITLGIVLTVIRDKVEF